MFKRSNIKKKKRKKAKKYEEKKERRIEGRKEGWRTEKKISGALIFFF